MKNFTHGSLKINPVPLHEAAGESFIFEGVTFAVEKRIYVYNVGI